MVIKLDESIIENAVKEYLDSEISVNACAKKHNIGAATLTRYLSQRKVAIKEQSNRKYFFDEDFFSVIDTEDKAYWLGFIAADGSIIHGSKYLEITLKATDGVHLFKMADSLGCSREVVKYRNQKCGNKRYPAARITLYSPKMCNDLSMYGIIQRKGFVLGFPSLEGEMLRHYLRGYFDGDGSISTNGKYRKGNPKYAANIIATESFLVAFMRHMSSIGITPVKLQQKGVMNVWNKCGANQLQILFQYFYEDCNVFLERKYQYFNGIAVQRQSC